MSMPFKLCSRENILFLHFSAQTIGTNTRSRSSPSSGKGIAHSHGLVGVTAEVCRDHPQPRGLETGQYHQQVLLEPQLVLTRLEEVKTGRQSRQRHVQDGVSHSCVFNELHVFLERRPFTALRPLQTLQRITAILIGGQCCLMQG